MNKNIDLKILLLRGEFCLEFGYEDGRRELYIGVSYNGLSWEIADVELDENIKAKVKETTTSSLDVVDVINTLMQKCEEAVYIYDVGTKKVLKDDWMVDCNDYYEIRRYE